MHPLRRRPRRPPAVVMGAGVNLIEVVRALSLGGIPSRIVAPARDAARLSRHAGAAVPWEWTDPAAGAEEERLLDRLLEFGERQASPPPLLFTSDEALLFVSRHEDVLRKTFRFAVADPAGVEAMVDKGLFVARAESAGLRVPRTCLVQRLPEHPPEEVSRLGFPLVVKPDRRDRLWHELVEPAKATLVHDAAGLDELWPRLAALGSPILLQECVPGPESRIESYHVYVDQDGHIVTDFSGCKIRTLPSAFGHTTSLTITDVADVLARGRELVAALDLRGVAKADYKRAPDGELVLLEVNPRFHLWHHPAARAGVNVPALVYADLIGEPRPPAGRARAGVRWVHPLDLFAAREAGLGRRQWLAWARGCEAKAFWAWNDPLPLAGAVLERAASRH